MFDVTETGELDWYKISRDPVQRRSIEHRLRAFFKKRFPKTYKIAMNSEELLQFAAMKRRRRGVSTGAPLSLAQQEQHRLWSCLNHIPDDVRYWFSRKRRPEDSALVA